MDVSVLYRKAREVPISKEGWPIYETERHRDIGINMGFPSLLVTSIWGQSQHPGVFCHLELLESPEKLRLVRRDNPCMKQVSIKGEPAKCRNVNCLYLQQKREDCFIEMLYLLFYSTRSHNIKRYVVIRGRSSSSFQGLKKRNNYKS